MKRVKTDLEKINNPELVERDLWNKWGLSRQSNQADWDTEQRNTSMRERERMQLTQKKPKGAANTNWTWRVTNGLETAAVCPYTIPALL